MSAAHRARPPRVTVIMRSKNAEWVIGDALAALFSQDYRDFELLVVDSGSTDRTLEIVSCYPHRLLRIDPRDYVPGRVLNYAAARTESELLVFQNSDGVPLTRSTLGRLVTAFDDPEVQAALARQLPRPEADTWVRRDYAVSFPDADVPPPWITLSLPMAAMRRSAWEAHPFYTASWGSEDTEWGERARRRGMKIAYVRDALVMHSHNYSLRELYGRRFIEGEADAFIYGRREGLARAALGTLASTARDWAAGIRAGDWPDVGKALFRRTVFHWAHLRGNRHGHRRLRTGDMDISVGQWAVLNRHDSQRRRARGRRAP